MFKAFPTTATRTDLFLKGVSLREHLQNQENETGKYPKRLSSSSFSPNMIDAIENVY